MQEDGNLVLYHRSLALWASSTRGPTSGGEYAVMQDDGNLVVYSRKNEPLWKSNTRGDNDNYLMLRDDAELIVFDSNQTKLWSTNTILSKFLKFLIK